ncbi:MAG: ATPase domain-containing protein [Candidatus Aenigmatarchaeota archaeon]
MAQVTDLTYYQFDLDKDTLATALGGGIPKGSMVLITGKFGSGKSVICQRFTYGFVKNGYTATYVSSETNTKPFINQMNSLDYPIKGEIYNQQLKFVPVNPLVGESCAREEALPRLIEGDGLYGRNITIVDTLSSLIEDCRKENLSLEALSFFKKICSKGKTLFLTLDPDEVDEDIMTPYKSAADIYLQLDRKTIGGETERMIHVRRFTSAKGRMQDVIKFRIEPNAGFVVDITQVT